MSTRKLSSREIIMNKLEDIRFDIEFLKNIIICLSTSSVNASIVYGMNTYTSSNAKSKLIIRMAQLDMLNELIEIIDEENKPIICSFA